MKSTIPSSLRFALCLLLAAAGPRSGATEAPVAWWKFDGPKAMDSAGGVTSVIEGKHKFMPEGVRGGCLRFDGFTTLVRQADILRPIAPVLSVRDDTFTIRAYGDSRDQNGKVMAKAWREAVVKRTRDFANNSEASDSMDPPAKQSNTTFGRRYEIFSFRWLHSDEV